jgi:hypothetical protein
MGSEMRLALLISNRVHAVAWLNKWMLLTMTESVLKIQRLLLALAFCSPPWQVALLFIAKHNGQRNISNYTLSVIVYDYGSQLTLHPHILCHRNSIPNQSSSFTIRNDDSKPFFNSTLLRREAVSLLDSTLSSVVLFLFHPSQQIAHASTHSTYRVNQNHT